MSIRSGAVTVVATAGLVAGCGLTSGTVVEKHYEPETMITTTILIGNAQYPQVVPVPECWALTVRDGDDVGKLCVPKPNWDATPIGAWAGEVS